MYKNLILQIDTSTAVCSVALSTQGKLLSVRDLEQPNVHASQLTLMIGDLLKAQQVAFEDLEAVAVAMGPGSYTGLRIGVSTAKGICYALGIPLIAVNTLTGLFEGYREQNQLQLSGAYIPMLDARRMEVYTAVYNGAGNLISPTSAEIIDEHYYEDLLSDFAQITLFGSGADKFTELFKNNDRIYVVSGFKMSASFLTVCAQKKLVQKDFENVAYFEPYYLKDFIATTPKKKIPTL